VTIIPGNKVDTTVASPLTTGAPSPTYTFSPTPYGTIQVLQNGKLIGTGTASYAAQYGYQPQSQPNQTLQAAPVRVGISTPAKPATTSQSSVSAGQISSTRLPTPAGSTAATTSPTLSLNPSLKDSVSLSPSAPQTQKVASPGSDNPAQSYNTGVTGFTQSTSNQNANGPTITVGVATQSIQGGNNPSYSGALVQETIHSGSMTGSLSVGNITGNLTATAGPLTGTLGANFSASVSQAQLTNSANGIAVSLAGPSAQAGATVSVSPQLETLSLGVGAYAAQASVDKQFNVGNFNVNLSASGGVGLGIGGSGSIGVGGVAASGEVGPVDLGVSITRD
jgi:hypothetical protein